MTFSTIPVAPTLDSPVVPEMTLREALRNTFNHDWNNRKVVAEATDDSATITVTLRFEITVPVAQAKQALKEMQS